MAKKKAEKESPFVPVKDQPYPVPENWCWTHISDVADVVTGGTPSKKNPAYYNGDFPFFKPADLDAGRHVFTGSEYLTDAGKAVSRIVPAKSTAVCCIGSIGKCGFLDIDGTTNQQINSLIPRINPLYIYYFCNTETFINQLWEKSSATTISIINKSKMENCLISLAPLAEQQRIVDRIESLFAKLDGVKEKVQEALAGFETRKVAVLYHAFTGKLTEKWRKANGIERTSWRLQLFSDLGSCQLGKMLDIEKNQGTMIGYLRNINVRWFDFDLSNIAQIRATDTEINKFSVHRGDLFICEGGEPGRCAIWKYDNQVLIFQKALHRFRAKENVLPQFVAYSILEKSLSGELNKYFTGTTIKHLTGKSLATLPVSLPTFDEQTEIVRILDEFFELEAQAKARAETVLEAIDTMKKSILVKAFRGELGTNNPEDESAEELLKRTLA